MPHVALLRTSLAVTVVVLSTLLLFAPIPARAACVSPPLTKVTLPVTPTTPVTISLPVTPCLGDRVDISAVFHSTDPKESLETEPRDLAKRLIVGQDGGNEFAISTLETLTTFNFVANKDGATFHAFLFEEDGDEFGTIEVTVGGTGSGSGDSILLLTRDGLGGGSVTSTPAGIDCGSTCGAAFATGTTVTLTAAPGSGSTFDGWGGACSGLHCTLTMSADAQVTATFTDRPPLDRFIVGLYEELLDRVPSNDEIAAWVSFARSHGQAGSGQMIHGFFDSAEYMSRPIRMSTYIQTLYRTVLGRDADQGEVDAWVPMLLSRLNTILPGFANSAEFNNLVTRDRSDQIVRRFYEKVLEREPAETETESWTGFVASGGTWNSVSVGFLDSPEYLSGSRPLSSYVATLYRTFLGREPDADGQDGWVSFLRSQLDEIQDGFINSPEFQARFKALLQ